MGSNSSDDRGQKTGDRKSSSSSFILPREREEIYKRIPHRPPFLWVDRILGLDRQSITTELRIPENLDIFRGHYPGHPLMPGVLLCEAVFQSGALLIAELLVNPGEADPLPGSPGVPVLTRISNAKFKQQVQPGDLVRMQVELVEVVGPAWFLKGRAVVADKVALKVEFGCALTPGVR